MTCCAALNASPAGPWHNGSLHDLNELRLASRDLGCGLRQTVLSVPDMHCASCISKVERMLAAVPGVELARANLSARRVTINWRTEDGHPPDLVGSLSAMGYTSHLPSFEEERHDGMRTELLGALAVAGFCSMNIMLLSVSVWSGADAATRQAFHLLSAVLATPAVFYSGWTFHRSAARALLAGRTNMDVPVSVGVLLAFFLSLYDAATAANHAYFEASTSLVFVLLVGRTLDHVMRRKARSAVAALAALTPLGANVLRDNGSIDYVPISKVEPGMQILVAAGERVSVDGFVVDGVSEIDRSLVTGESRWKSVKAGDGVRAGDLNFSNPLVLRASAWPDDTLVSEMTRMLEAAETARSGYRRLADRAGALYAPVVHGLAALAFIFWFWQTGDVHQSLTVAIAVLIITCPCALGLAVPIVHVVAAARLFERGVLARDGSAFERLAEIDTVVFDKTGTLTTGEIALREQDRIPSGSIALAVSMARHSRHPVSVAIVRAYRDRKAGLPRLDSVREYSGEGIEARIGADIYRLGKPSWATNAEPDHDRDEASAALLSENGRTLATFSFAETLRPGARLLVGRMKAKGLTIRLLSGDAPDAVRSIAADLGIDDCKASMLPGDKVRAMAELHSQGYKVLMIGDGANDAPALKAAHVSMAPASASDVGRAASDFVFLEQNLDVVVETIDIVERAATLVKQNFAVAILYNAISLPIAFVGQVTPLAAAIAMSTSSILVVANAMRLRWSGGATKTIAGHRGPVEAFP
jgi:Cu2+-exporting ATPase